MNEFVDYIDVKENEQNPFQTQDLANAARQVADLKATQYLNEIQNAPTRYFNVDFYMNPTGNIGRQAAYSEQGKVVQRRLGSSKTWRFLLDYTGVSFWCRCKQ
jgi:hypothetical protein